TGQVSGDLDLMEKLPARVGYPIESLAPRLECPKHMPVSQYAVNIGLALKGTVPAKSLEQDGYLPPDINLLPETYKAWKPSARQLYFACAVIAAIALLFPLYQLTSGAMDKTADLERRYNILSDELQLKQLEIKNREPLQKAIGEYNTIVNMGGGFTEDLTVIKSEAERLGVRVESIAHEGERSIGMMRIIEAHCQLQIHCQALYPVFPGKAILLPGYSAHNLRCAIDHYNDIKTGGLNIEDKGLLFIYCSG
ncbi:unnamed protein product, partial [marine sediment metagenome]